MSLSSKQTIIQSDSPFISAYSPKSTHASLVFPENSEFTKQEFKQECDVNVILAQYQHTGEIPNLNERQGQYIDCTGMDYTAHMHQILEANSLFMDLPSSIRDRFHNDPARFLDFVHDENNRDELRKMGLLRPVPDVVPPPASVLGDDLPITSS